MYSLGMADRVASFLSSRVSPVRIQCDALNSFLEWDSLVLILRSSLNVSEEVSVGDFMTLCAMLFPV